MNERLDCLAAKSEQRSGEQGRTLLPPASHPKVQLEPEKKGPGKELSKSKRSTLPSKVFVDGKVDSRVMRTLSKKEWSDETSSPECVANSLLWLVEFEYSELDYVYMDPFQVDAAGAEESVETSVSDFLVFGSQVSFVVAFRSLLNFADLMGEAQRAKKRLARDLPVFKQWVINHYRRELQMDASEENVERTQVYITQVEVIEGFKILMDNITNFYHGVEHEKEEAMAVIVQIFVFLESLRKERAAVLKGKPHARVRLILMGLKLTDYIFSKDGVIREKNDPTLPLMVNQKLRLLEEARIASVVNRVGRKGGRDGGSKGGGAGTSVVTFFDKRRIVSDLFAEFSGFKHGQQAVSSAQSGGKKDNGCILCGSCLGSYVGSAGPHTFSHCPKKAGENKTTVLEDLLVANAAVLAKYGVTKDVAKSYFQVVT